MPPVRARTDAQAPRERRRKTPTFDPYDASRRPGEEYAWIPVFEHDLHVPARWRFRWVHESEIDAEPTL